MTDLTSVIKIHLKKIDSTHLVIKVTHDHWNRHGSISLQRFPISVSVL